MVRNTVGIWIAARLHYLLIIVKLTALETLFFSDTQNPKPVCYQIDSQWQTLSA